MTQTPLSWSKGQKSTCRGRGHIVVASRTACSISLYDAVNGANLVVELCLVVRNEMYQCVYCAYPDYITECQQSFLAILWGGSTIPHSWGRLSILTCKGCLQQSSILAKFVKWYDQSMHVATWTRLCNLIAHCIRCSITHSVYTVNSLLTLLSFCRLFIV